MKKLYQKLYECFDSSAELSSLSHFTAMCGHTYQQLPNKLMVVGRATNGWEALDCSTAESFGTIAQQRFEQIGFDWILQTDKGFGNGDDYLLSKSAFWRVLRNICYSMNTLTDNCRWFESLLWSNIYKIAPPDDTEHADQTKNPSNRLCRKQIAVCREILRKEIETYKPTHILFITGYDWWFYDESTKYGVHELFSACQKIENKYVNGTARYISEDLNIPVVIASRPERKNESEYVEVVLKALI